MVTPASVVFVGMMVTPANVVIVVYDGDSCKCYVCWV